MMFLKDFSSGNIRTQILVRRLVVVVPMGSAALYL